MKNPLVSSSRPRFAPLACSMAALLAASASAASISWTGATDSIWASGPGANWLGGVAPGLADIALFDANSIANLTTTLGAPFTVLGVKVTAPAGPVSIGGPDVLTLAGSGIDLSTATQNLTIAAPLSLSANQTWNVAAGRVLAVSGGLTRTAPTVLSTNGPGQIQISGAMSVDQLLIGSGVAAGEVVFSGAGSAWTQAGTITALGLAVGNANGSGSATFSGGTHTFGGDGYGSAVRVGVTTAAGQTANGTMTVSGATVKIGTAGALDASFNLGVMVGGATAANGTLNVSAGRLEVGRRILMAANGAATTAVVNLSGTGTIEMKRTGSGAEGDLGMLRVGAGTATFNLDGGTLIASAINTGAGATTRTFLNYNGTTVRANVATAAFITSPTLATHRVKAGGFIFDTNGFDVTYGGALVNDTGVNGTITKTGGAGVLTLSAANTTTGQVSINAGTLALAAAGTFGAATPIVVGTGATFRFDRTDTFGANAAAISQTITVNGGTVSNGGNFFNTLGALTLNGGTLNSIGGVNANFPSFSLKGPITVGGSAPSTISGSGTNSQMLIGGITAGTLTTFDVANATGDSAADLIVSVPLQNGRNAAFAEIATGFTKTGNGTMSLTAANTFTGNKLVNAGTLLVNGGTLLGPGLIDIGSVGNAADFALTAGSVAAGSQFVIGAHGSTGTAAISGGTLQVNGTIYVGGYSEGTGTGTFTQTAGTVTATAGVNFGGGGPNNGVYNLNGGTLTTTVVAKGGSGTATFNFNGGTLRPSVASATFLQGLTAASVQSGGAIIDTNNFDTTIAQPLLDGGGGGGLTKNGNGILTLPGAHTFTGNIAVNAGGLALSAGTYAGGLTLANNTRFSSASGLVGATTFATLTLGTSTTLDFHFGVGNDVITIANPNGLTLGGTGINLFQDGNTLPYAAAGTYTLFDYDTAFTGSLAGLSVANPSAGKAYAFTNDPVGTTIQLTITNLASQWIASGGGLWTDSANWNASGVPNSPGAAADFNTSISGPATITMNGAKTVGGIVFNNATDSYTVSGGAPDTLTLDSGSPAAASISVVGAHAIATPVVLVNDVTITTNPASTLTISGDISGAKTLTAAGFGGVVLTGSNSYDATAINGGTLQIGNGGTTGTLGSGAVTSSGNGVLVFNRSDDLTIGNLISGTGGVRKVGDNKLTLTATNSHTGGVAITGGTVRISANENLGGTTGALTLDKDSFSITAALETTTTMTMGARPIVVGPGGGAIKVASATTLTAAGILSGAGPLTKADDGTLTLTNAASTFTGDLTIAGGTVIGTTGGGGTNSVFGRANVFRAINVNSGATLQFNAHDTFGNDGANPAVVINVNGGNVINGPAGAVQSFTTFGPVNLTNGTITSTGGANASFQAYQLKGMVTSSGASFINTTATPAPFNGVHLFGTTTFNVTDGTLTVSAPLLTGNRAAASLAKTGAGTLTITGPQSYSTLTTSEGITNIASALGTGTSTLNANATTNISISQTLAALNIGDGATVTLAEAAPAPAPEFAWNEASAAQAVPEPGSAALLLGGLATLLGLRRRTA